MTARTSRSSTSSKNEKDFANLEITTSLELLREEQKKGREQNKTLKNELKKLVSELFTYPELRLKANRLLDRAVEAATQELTTKNFSQTKLNLETKLLRPMKTQDENQDPSEIEAVNEESCPSEQDRGSYEEVEITEREELEEYTIELSDEQSVKLVEDDEIEIEEKSLAEEFSSTVDNSAEQEILFEDFIWQVEENMAKNIFEANEQLLKAENENDEIKNANIMLRTVYENPFEINVQIGTRKNAQKSVSWENEIAEISAEIADLFVETKEKLIEPKEEAEVDELVTEEEEEAETLATIEDPLSNRAVSEIYSLNKEPFDPEQSLNESEITKQSRETFINNDDNLLYDMLSDVYQVEDSYTPTEKESTQNIQSFNFINNNDNESESKSIGFKCPDFQEQVSEDL